MLTHETSTPTSWVNTVTLNSPVWSHANIGTANQFTEWVSQTSAIDEEALVNLFYHVRDKAYKIIEKRRNTTSIGVSLVRILKAILNDNAILPVSFT